MLDRREPNGYYRLKSLSPTPTGRFRLDILCELGICCELGTNPQDVTTTGSYINWCGAVRCSAVRCAAVLCAELRLRNVPLPGASFCNSQKSSTLPKMSTPPQPRLDTGLTRDSEFLRNSLMLCTHFIRRKYPRQLLIDSLARAKLQPRAELIKPKTKLKQEDKPKAFYCITTHNPPIKRILTENWDQMKKTKTTREFHGHKLVFGNRRNKSLGDELVRASTSQKTPTTKVPHIIKYPCNTPLKCRYCPIINKSGFIQSTTNGRKFRTLTSVNCQSANIVYAITCKNCGIQYVGQTLERLMDRFQGHSGDIDNNRDKPVGRHFNLCPPPPQNPARWKGFDITVLSFIKSPPRSPAGVMELNVEERRWMHRLRSITPNGLNLLD